MKAYLNKMKAKTLLLTLDSENEAEEEILMEMANTVPILHIVAKGNTVDGVGRIQYSEPER